MMFIAHVAPQTRYLRLGTGVVSLPYHNPLWVADRMVLLDHLTRGRAMLGLGAGALTTDANMVGIDASEQRDALEVDTNVLVHLLTNDEPISIETSRYRLVDARLQLDCYSDPHFEIAVAALVSPSGPRLAGKHNLGMLSIAATAEGAFDAVAQHWGALSTRASEFGHVPDRTNWRLVAPFHIAETKDQAVEEVTYGIDAWCDFMQHTSSTPGMNAQGKTTKERIDWIIESGTGVIGTYKDAIAQIERLWSKSDGGFGCMLLFDHNWASWRAKREHYHIFANYVIPYFQGTTARLQSNEQWARSLREDLAAKTLEATRAYGERFNRQNPSR